MTAAIPPVAVGDRVAVVAPGSLDHGLVGTVAAIDPTFAGGLANPWPYWIEIDGCYRLRLAAGEFVAVDEIAGDRP